MTGNSSDNWEMDRWQALQRRAYAVAKARGQVTTFEDMLKALAGEVIEVALCDDEVYYYVTVENEGVATDKLREELADVVLISMTLAERYNIDLYTAIKEKMAVNEGRMP